MELLYDRAEKERISAPAAARLYAYAGVTLYQAVLPGIPGDFSLSGQLNGLPDIPYPDEGVYDWPSAANGALSTVLESILPDTSARFITVLRQSEMAAREREVDPDVVERSMQYGEQVGEIILEWVAEDNYEATRDLDYEIPTGDPAL